MLSLGLVAGGSVPPAAAASPADDLPPIVGSWQIAAMAADGSPFYIQYTFTSDGIVWVFVPDGRHGSGHWEEDAQGQVTMSFVIQSGTEAVPYVERIWEEFPMPAQGADTWASAFSYYSEDIDGNIIEGGPAGSVVARRFDVRPDLDAQTIVAPPAVSPGPSVAPGSPAAMTTPSTTLGVGTSADDPGHFDVGILRAPAGTEVTVTYDNDSTQFHNVAFFAGDSIDDPLIARTEPAVGPGTQEVTFITPTEPGTYRFACQLHPISMTGTLVID
jgi:plastocyanin